MKKLIVFIFVLLFIGSTSATLLLLHPPKIEFNGNTNEKICQNISVFSDYKGNLTAKIRWTDKNGSKNLNDYELNSSNLRITNDFSEKVVSNNKMKEVDICLTFEKSGEYSGALLYNTENSPAGVGIWVYANIKGNNYNINISKVTGNLIISLKNVMNNSKNQKGLLVSSTTFLLFILFMLLLFVEKRMEKEEIKEDKVESENEIKSKNKNDEKPAEKKVKRKANKLNQNI